MSRIKIQYKKPLNVSGNLLKLFKPDNKYLNVNLGVRTLNDVFVNHYGLVLKNGFLVKGCAPNIGFSFYDKSAFFKHWRKGLEQVIVSKHGKSIPYEKWDDDTKYLVIHSPWFSYYFWITECLPRLLRVKDILDELILIYPETWDNFSFVKESLELFPDLKIRRLKKDIHLRVKNLVMPEVKPWTPMFIPEDVKAVRELLFEAAEKKGIQSKYKTDKIYITRRGAKRRKFDNEPKVEVILSQYGFQAVEMEKLTFFEQIALMKDTKYMTAITGAGLINILFMKKGGAFLDLTNEAYKTKKQYRFHYFKLCNLLNIDYAVSFFKHENDKEVDHYSNQNLLLDEKQLRNDIELILDGGV